MKLIDVFHKHQFYAVLLLVIFAQALLMLQGFDVCDDGFVLTFYQQIFLNPESVEYNFLYWFNGIVGGLWYRLYEDGGVLWFRLLAIIVNTLTLVISYNLLKHIVPKSFLLVALVIVLFVNDYGFLTFYHNHLTALMVVISIALMYNAIVKNNTALFILAGFVIGLNVFTRLPNLVVVVLLLGIPFYFFLQKKKVVGAVKYMLLSGLGIVLAFGSVFITLKALGQFEIMKNSIFVLQDLGGSEDSPHNLYDVIKAQYVNYKQIIKALIQFIIIVSAFIFSINYLKNKVVLKAVLKFIVVCLFMLWLHVNGIFAIYTLALLGSIIAVFNRGMTNEIRLIGFLSLMILLVLSLGTGGGIYNSGFMAIWIGLPLFFIGYSVFDKKFQIQNSLIKVDFNGFKSSQTKQLLTLFVLAFFILKPYKIFNQAYFEKGSRWYKTEQINHSKASGIYTTKYRAEIMNDILLELENHVQPDDYLFAYNNIPMFHFLTETKPYLYNPWVGIYDNVSFEKKIEKAQKEIEVLPVVLQQKFNTVLYFHPPSEDYMSADKPFSFNNSPNITEMMNNFLSTNNYEIVWSNDYFNILKPKL